jgi:hypothetical protein
MEKNPNAQGAKLVSDLGAVSPKVTSSAKVQETDRLLGSTPVVTKSNSVPLTNLGLGNRILSFFGFSSTRTTVKEVVNQRSSSYKR